MNLSPNYQNNPFTYLRIYHDVDTRKDFKRYEKISIDIGCIQQRLTFLHKCKKYGVVPRSLKVKQLVKSLEGKRVAKNTERRFLSAGITKCHKDINFLSSTLSSLEISLEEKLDAHYFYLLKRYTLNKTIKVSDQVKRNLIKKITLLLNRFMTKAHDEPTTNSWVLNLSKKPLTPSDESLLKKGLNYAVTPRKYEASMFLAPIERAICELPADKNNEIRLSVTSMMHFYNNSIDNLTTLERSSLQKLNSDNSIVILPADKGRTSVVMDIEDYTKKINDLLLDEKTYEVVKCDPTVKLETKLNNTLLELFKNKSLDKVTYDQVRCTNGSIPRFYGLPKVHKENIPLGPIVSFVTSPCYKLSKYLSKVLSPFSLNELSTRTSLEFCSSVGNRKLRRGEIFVSFDVVSLFTCIPTELACTAAFRSLCSDTNLKNRTSLTPVEIEDLLKLCLNSTTFICNGKYYKQKFGTAMGSPVSPVVANLVMNTIETETLNNYASGPTFWTCYVDDVFCIIQESNCDDFLKHLNSINEHIQFTMEKEKDQSISFLDVLIKHDNNGNISTSVFRKKTCTDRLLDFNSEHPISHKISTVKTLFKRARSIPSSQDGVLAEESRLGKIFKLNNYPNWFTEQHKKECLRRNNRTKEENIYTSIPFIKGLSEPIGRILKKNGIRCCFRPITTLRETLSHPKDKIPFDDRSSVVYSIPCQDCTQEYVGQTRRKVGTRIKEHMKCVKDNDINKSAIALHHLSSNHNINWSGSRILHNSNNTRDRLFLEGWEVRNREVFEKNRALNIPEIYKALKNKTLGLSPTVS